MTRGDAAAVPTARIAVCFGARGDGAGDDAAKEGEEDAAKEGEKDAAEGEDGVAEGEAGEGKSAVDFVAAAAKAPRLTALTWLPADAAARSRRRAGRHS